MPTVDLVRHVRTKAGADKFGEPIGSPIVPHPDVKKFTKEPGALAKATSTDQDKEDFFRKRAEDLFYQNLHGGITAAQHNELAAYIKGRPEAIDELKTATKKRVAAEQIATKPKKWDLSRAEVVEQVQSEEALANQIVSDPAGLPSAVLNNGAPDSNSELPEYMQSARQQIAAQYMAHTVSVVGHGMGYPAAVNFWLDYQDSRKYQDINARLRGSMPQTALEDARGMFQKMGYTTAEPMATYRGITGTADQFKVGATITDPGMCSTTAQEKFAAGWLTGPLKNHKVDPDKDVVVQIALPPGARVVGGSLGFCETMLPPGVPLKVKSVEKRSENALNPVTAKFRQITYTYVRAEVDPSYDWTQWYGSGDKRGAEQLEQFASHA